MKWKPSDLQPGKKLNQPGPLFKKLEIEMIEVEREDWESKLKSDVAMTSDFFNCLSKSGRRKHGVCGQCLWA